MQAHYAHLNCTHMTTPLVLSGTSGKHATKKDSLAILALGKGNPGVESTVRSEFMESSDRTTHGHLFKEQAMDSCVIVWMKRADVKLVDWQALLARAAPVLSKLKVTNSCFISSRKILEFEYQQPQAWNSLPPSKLSA